MEITDVLRVLDGHDLAQLAGIQDFSELAEEIGVAQHMADGDLLAQGIGLLLNLDAFLGIGGDGLLQQDVIAAVQSLHDVTVVIPVHGGDDGCIRDLTQGKEVIGIGEAAVSGNIPFLGHMGQTVGADLRNGCDFDALIMGPVAIDGAAGTGTDEDVFHMYCLLLYLFSVYHSQFNCQS